MRSLFYREMPRGDDVAAAIHTIVQRNPRGLPIAVSKDDVLAELMHMARTKDDGTVVEQSASAKKFVELSYRNTLTETSVFQSGYERYEDGENYGNNPVVPVTDFFFRYIYSEGEDVRQLLNAMRPHEIAQSLPKRPSVPVDKDAQIIVEGEHGDRPAQKVGKIAGIVVLPNGDAGIDLLRAWLSRKGQMAVGMAKKVATNLEHVHGTETVKSMRRTMNHFEKGMREMLPPREEEASDEEQSPAA